MMATQPRSRVLIPSVASDAWSSDVTRRRLVSGGGWSLATWLLSLAVGLPLTIALVRLMSASQYGVLALAGAISGLITPIVGLGLAASVASLGAAAASKGAAELNAIGRAALYAVRFATLGAVTLVAGITLLLTVSRSLHAAAIPFAVLGAAVLLIPIRDASMGMLQVAFDPVRPFAAGSAQAVAVATLTGAALVSGHRSALVVAVARAASVLVGAALLTSGARWRQHGLKPHSAARARTLMAFGVVLLLSSSLSQVFTYLDVVFLGTLNGTAAVAAYAPVSTLAAAVTAASAVLGLYMLPALSAALARGDLLEAGRVYRWASRWAATFAGPAAVLLVVAPNSLLAFLFGTRSAAMVTPARILSIGILVNLVLGYNWIVLAADGRRWGIALTSLLGIATSALACVLLVPRWGAMGAAWATSISLIVTNFAVSGQLLWSHRMSPVDRPFVFTLGALGLAGLVSSLTHHALPGGDLAQVVSTLVFTTTVAVITSLVGGGRADRKLAIELLHGVARSVGRRQPLPGQKPARQ